MARRASKIDANQDEIVRVARQIGATVCSLAAVGQGCPDLVIGWRGKNYLLEIKDGNKSPSRRKLTTAEERFHAKWQGQVDVVESVEDLLRLLLIDPRAVEKGEA